MTKFIGKPGSKTLRLQLKRVNKQIKSLEESIKRFDSKIPKTKKPKKKM